MSLGQLIRTRREQLNMTLDEVSRQTGYSKPYLSTIENDKVKNPPADELLVRLERLLKFSDMSLVHVAHMEKLPADVQEAFERNHAELKQWQDLVKRLLAAQTSLDTLRDERIVQDLLGNGQAEKQPEQPLAVQLVPIINRVAGGYPVEYDPQTHLASSAVDYVRVPHLHDVAAFAVTVVGDDMQPCFAENDIVVFSPAEKIKSGNDCFVRVSEPRQMLFRQVFFDSKKKIRLQPHNHNHAPLTLPTETVTGIWRAVCHFRRL